MTALPAILFAVLYVLGILTLHVTLERLIYHATQRLADPVRLEVVLSDLAQRGPPRIDAKPGWAIGHPLGWLGPLLWQAWPGTNTGSGCYIQFDDH